MTTCTCTLYDYRYTCIVIIINFDVVVIIIIIQLFLIQAIHRKLVRGSQQRVFEAMLEIVEKSLSEQKV